MSDIYGRSGRRPGALVAFTAAFLLLQALPGDAILIKFMSPELGLSADQIAEIRASVRRRRAAAGSSICTTVGNFLTGNFGYSIQAGVPVSQQLAANLPPTAAARRRWPSSLAVILAVALAALSTLTPASPGCARASSRCRRCSSRCRCSGSASC